MITKLIFSIVFYWISVIKAYPTGVAEAGTVITNETLTLDTFWQSRGVIRQTKAISLRFRVEELFLDSKFGAFGLADSRLRMLSQIYFLRQGDRY